MGEVVDLKTREVIQESSDDYVLKCGNCDNITWIIATKSVECPLCGNSLTFKEITELPDLP